MNCDSIELLPNPSILIQSMRHIGYTVDTAIADIIDNSIAANASKVSVQYRWNDGNPWIAIIDDGCGMTFDEIKEAMRFGGAFSPTQNRNASDLGRFGLGLKTASLSQCSRLTVISKKDNDICSCVWDVDIISKLPSPKWNALLPKTEVLKEDPVIGKLLPRLDNISSGTIVIWQKLENISTTCKKDSPENNFAETMNNASKHVAMVFHRFFVLEKGYNIVKIDFNDTIVEGINPFGIAVPARQELPSEKLILEGQDIIIQPFILPHSSKVSRADYEKYGGEDGYLHNQGFYVYRNRRLIIKGTWFRIMPKTELHKLIRIRIDIPNSLDHLWQLDVKKSNVEPPLPVLARLKKLLPSLSEIGKRPYTKRGSREISDVVHIWRREFSNNKVSYIINDEHPFVKNLIADENGKIDPQKLSYLRIISGAFPTDSFHVDVNNDTKTAIVSAAQQDDMEMAVRSLIAESHSLGMNKDDIRNLLNKNELLISNERQEELLEEEFNG